MAKNKPNHGAKREAIARILEVSEGYDSIYQEPFDGFLGIKRVPGQNNKLEMINVIDFSTLTNDKHIKAARKRAGQLERLGQHPNLLNILKPFIQVK